MVQRPMPLNKRKERRPELPHQVFMFP